VKKPKDKEKATWAEFSAFGDAVAKRSEGGLDINDVKKLFSMANNLDETTIPDDIAFPYDGRDEEDERRARSSSEE